MIPRATYRLQFHRGFTFADATAIVPYLAALGVSHVYASPYLKAREGSTHGYDIVDHNALNPEIGTPEDFEAFVGALARHGLRQMLDIVPNHMGVMEADNGWWLDVLENGRSSRYAEYFDIEWEPFSDELRGKVLLPVLGEQYGTVLERGELQVAFDAAAGEFSLRYFKHRFPLDPRGYRQVIEAAPAAADDAGRTELDALLAAFEALPVCDDTDAAARNARAARASALKQALAALGTRAPAVARHIERSLAALNGTPGESASFDRLHALIKTQSFRLAYWRVAADDINYRRFFEINDLAALRMERPEVFGATHRLVLRLVAEGKVDALRIDHPDGLYDPRAYFDRLQAAVQPPAPAGELPIYLVIEKITAGHERLPEHWRVHGTTGYRFANVVNGLFVDTAAAARMERIYASFLGAPIAFDDLLREAKTAVMTHGLSSELHALTTMLDRIAKADRHTCDYTFASLRQALLEVIAAFPVYRTYLTDTDISTDDRRHIEWAVAIACKRRRAAERSVFAFIRAVLLDGAPGKSAAHQARVRRFTGRFQQLTSPVMAKGMEDTSFYVYNRLASLNEVGGDPRTFGMTLKAFHAAAADRAKCWPHTMLATSTHDTKRSEDVRVRISALSEMPAAWRLALRRWSQMNRRLKRGVDGAPAPSRNDEYLLYQTLLGAWPANTDDPSQLAAFSGRIQQYMLKAAREAKVWTSWLYPNEAYEEALSAFVAGILAPGDTNLFLHDFHPAQALIARLGVCNGLAQTLLKMVSPGVPDLYQGTELWDYSLVDPDNRRPVDYARRSALLDELAAGFAAGDGPCATRARALLDAPDGRAKLYVTWRALALRARLPLLFERGEYVPLATEGPQASHVCAFARHLGTDARQAGVTDVVAVVPRLIHGLLRGAERLPLGPQVWTSSALRLTGTLPSAWRNVLTGERITATLSGRRRTLPLAAVLEHFPVALLVPDAPAPA